MPTASQLNKGRLPINHETDLFRKATYALFLAERHPFWDGQKRMAFMLADGILLKRCTTKRGYI